MSRPSAPPRVSCDSLPLSRDRPDASARDRIRSAQTTPRLLPRCSHRRKKKGCPPPGNPRRSCSRARAAPRALTPPATAPLAQFVPLQRGAPRACARPAAGVRAPRMKWPLSQAISVAPRWWICLSFVDMDRSQPARKGSTLGHSRIRGLVLHRALGPTRKNGAVSVRPSGLDENASYVTVAGFGDAASSPLIAARVSRGDTQAHRERSQASAPQEEGAARGTARDRGDARAKRRRHRRSSSARD
jgi:hypothetical protein